MRRDLLFFVVTTNPLGMKDEVGVLPYFVVKLFFRLAAMCVAARSSALEVVFGVGSYMDQSIRPFLGSTRKRVPRYGPSAGMFESERVVIVKGDV